MDKLRFVLAGLLVGLCTAAAAETRTTYFSYHPNGLLRLVDGPRDDLTDVTTYEYTASGDLLLETNALGHETNYTDYDGAGRLKRMVDPNGLVTSYTHYPRGWLHTVTVGNEVDQNLTTEYVYDAAGYLTDIILPNDDFVHYERDAAGRIDYLYDNSDARIDYTYDVMNNVTHELILDAQGYQQKGTKHEYDDLNRLRFTYEGWVSDTEYERKLGFDYDANGNRTHSRILEGPNEDPVQEYIYDYDALDRLDKITDPRTGETDIVYNPLDDVEQVTDPGDVATQYVVNAFGEVEQEISPNRGTTTYSYDPAGNLSYKIDGRNIRTDYVYDALNRLTDVIYQNDTDKNITLTYDQGTYGVGRLSKVEDGSGHTLYDYDLFGRLRTETREVRDPLADPGLPPAFVTQVGYYYDDLGRLQWLVYPSGRIVLYEYGVRGVHRIWLQDVTGPMQVLVDDVTHLPFGPIESLQLTSTIAVNRTYDQAYRQTDLLVDGVANETWIYNDVGNIEGWLDNLDPTRDQSFGYNATNQLTTADSIAGRYGSLVYDYDLTGNRWMEDDNGLTRIYSYEPDSQLLSSIDTTLSFDYDAAGNMTDRDAATLTYDDSGRLVAYDDGLQLAAYVHDAFGARIQKTVNGLETHFRYSQDGMLLGEYDSAGLPIHEYVYIGNEPIAMLVSTAPPADSTILQPGNAQQAWQTIAVGPYDEIPVVITGPPTVNGGAPIVVNVRNITPTSAQITVREFEYQDGVHGWEDIAVLSTPPGRYVQPDGSIWEFGTFQHSGTGVIGSFSFTEAFPDTPYLFLTQQTTNDPAVSTVRADAVTSEGFEAIIQEAEESTNQHGQETIGYLAIYSRNVSGTVTLNGIPLSYSLQSVDIKKQWVTVGNQELMLKEESSVDAEQYHAFEDVHILELDDAIFAQIVSLNELDTVVVRAQGDTVTDTAISGAPLFGTDIRYLITDHLGAVTKAIDPNGNIVWDAFRAPFGELAMLVEQITMPLRFPGQYYDDESGLHYNYFRDYDPSTGRYIQSDPIGLEGGLNTYGYVDSNPLRYSDPFGLSKFDKFFGLPKKFWQWYHRNEKRPGDPDLDRESAEDLYEQWKKDGQPGPDNKGDKGGSDFWQWLVPPGFDLACTVDPCNPFCKDLGYKCPYDDWFNPNCEI